MSDHDLSQSCGDGEYVINMRYEGGGERALSVHMVCGGGVAYRGRFEVAALFRAQPAFDMLGTGEALFRTLAAKVHAGRLRVAWTPCGAELVFPFTFDGAPLTGSLQLTLVRRTGVETDPLYLSYPSLFKL